MKVIFCIDDTDNLASTRGTGELAAMMIKEIECRGWGRGEMIVRHQLYFHPDIPYTSHNSAMSFAIEVFKEEFVKGIISFAGEYLAVQSEQGSDPGLCAAIVEQLTDTDQLIDFGRQAKCKVLSKGEAYDLAKRVGIHLSEHGGSGDGVIGALAGAGLRLSGNDGRVRGKHLIEFTNNALAVGSIYQQAKIDLIRSTDGTVPKNSDLVYLSEKVKSVYQDGKSVLLVCPNDDSKIRWKTCSIEYIKSITD